MNLKNSEINDYLEAKAKRGDLSEDDYELLAKAVKLVKFESIDENQFDKIQEKLLK